MPQNMGSRAYVRRSLTRGLTAVMVSNHACYNNYVCDNILILVISRHVNASDVYAVPFTVVFWQERELTSQSKFEMLVPAVMEV